MSARQFNFIKFIESLSLRVIAQQKAIHSGIQFTRYILDNCDADFSPIKAKVLARYSNNAVFFGTAYREEEPNRVYNTIILRNK